jgi:type I restriction enzyme, S subunit
LLRITDIKSNFLDTSDIYLITKELSAEFKRSVLIGGEVLLSIQGTIGRVAICPNEYAGANISRTIALIDPDKRMGRHFLRYCLLNMDGTFPTGGATRASLNIGDIRNLLVPLPTIEEQQRIVEVLDEAFEGLTRARAHAEANLQNARELFESFLAHLFLKEHWPTRSLSEISDNLDRVRVPITKGDRISGNVPYYGASGVVDHVANHLFDEDLLLVSEDGANLLARTYPIAFSISGKSWVNNHAHVLRFPDLDTQEFVRLYLNSISLEPYVSGMAQPKLNQAQLNRIPVPFPSAAERAEIVARADLFSAQTEDLQRRYQTAIADVEALRQSLLQKAFAGELIQ